MSGGRSMRAPEGEAGMILINVLLIVALAASVVVLMTTSQDLAIARSVRLREAAEAAAVARGGELSAIAALRRAAGGDARADLAALAPVSQRAVRIEGGSFTLTLADAQARYNLATVRASDSDSLAVALRVGRAAGIGAAEMTRLAVLAGTTPSALADPRATGLDDAAALRLGQVATVLPVPSQVNLESASAPLVSALLGDPAAAGTLLALRSRRGMLTDDDLQAANVTLPPTLVLGTNLYWVRSRATIGDTAQQLTSLLLRRFRDGRPEVIAIGRWWGPASPLAAPAS